MHVEFVMQVLCRAVFSTEKQCGISVMYDAAIPLPLHEPECMRGTPTNAAPNFAEALAANW